MKCTIPGVNVKVFGRAIHSLSKIGEELYVEPLPNGLALRTVNSSRSAYGCFMFAPSFFTKYSDGSTQAESAGDGEGEEVVRCRILMKSVMSVFKSLSTLERTVDNCKILLNSPQSLMRFQLHCRHGIVKTYNLSFIECETLQAVYSKDLSPNVLTAQSRLLCDVVGNFQPSQEEVTLSLTPEKVAVRNYVDDEPDPNKVMRTEMSLVPDEFESFQAGVDADVTFCLKELRAILAFSESANLPVTIRFQSPGTPIVFSLDSETTYEANFVLATLAAGQGGGDGANPSHNTTHNSTHNISHRTVERPAAKSTGRKHRLYNGSVSTPRYFADSVQPGTSRRPSRARHDSTVRPDEESAGPSLHEVSTDQENTMIAARQPASSVGERSGLEHRQESSASSQSEHRGDGDSRLKPLAPLMLESDEDEEEQEEEMLPATPPPPSKKFKSLFFGESQPTQTTQTPVGKVLCGDSDDET